MSEEYKGQNPLDMAKQAERDLSTQAAKGQTSTGTHLSDSTQDSGINENATTKFPGATVQIGGQGAGNNREIPLEEGGEIDRDTGQPTKARDFEGVGGPEDKKALAREERGGDDDVRENVRQGGETRRP